MHGGCWEYEWDHQSLMTARCVRVTIIDDFFLFVPNLRPIFKLSFHVLQKSFDCKNILFIVFESS